MFFRYVIALILVLVLTLPAFAQSSSVVVESDLRLFTTMAALNAAGFDVEIASQYHAVRAEVRKYAEGLDPDLLQRLKTFYRNRKAEQSDEAQLSKYISLAVMLTDPPELKLTFREELLPPDARTVLGFADLLREFYQKARIYQRWAELRPQYEEAINQFGPRLREAILKTDAYLRVPLGGPLLRTLAIYVELAAPVNSVNVRSYQDHYYVVLGGSGSLQIDDVRHAYLHFHLDNLVARNITKIENGGSLLTLVDKVDGVEAAYTGDFHIMATESLIRSLELRMDRTPAAPARESVNNFYRSGLLLVPYFYDELAVYEERAQGIRQYFGEMAAAIKVKDEQQRFREKFHTIPIPQKAASHAEVPEAPPAPPPNPTRDLLKEGEAAFNANDVEKARAAFEKVLTDYDRDNGAALYGLALIASKDENRETAQRYFERTIQSPSAEPSMRVWSYVFLGRIFDLQCNRERAVEYYRQAIKVGDNTRNAQAAAGEGVKKPYGEGCR